MVRSYASAHVFHADCSCGFSSQRTVDYCLIRVSAIDSILSADKSVCEVANADR